jgi:hypothetical protein
MTQSAVLSVKSVAEVAFDVVVDGESFRVARSADSVGVEALRRGEVLERLDVSRIDEGLRVVVRDRTGRTAVYLGREAPDRLSATILVDGSSHELDVGLDTPDDELAGLLTDVRLPRLTQLLRLSRRIRDDADFRAGLRQGLAASEGTHGGMSSDCVGACLIAVKLTGQPIGVFADGYCCACLIYS